jgi:hypothetical protein
VVTNKTTPPLTPPTNDNPEPSDKFVMFSDLVAASGVSEDEMLHRLARILAKRIEDQTPKPELVPEDAPGHTDLMVSPESIDAFLDANPPPDLTPPWLTPAVQERATAEVQRVLAQHRAASGWQPIETAPKDGYEVDLFGGGRRWENAWWHPRGGGWLYRDTDHDPGRPIPCKITHWMRVGKPSDAPLFIDAPDLATQIVLAVLAACVPQVDAMVERLLDNWLSGPRWRESSFADHSRHDMRAALLAAMRGE